MPLLRWLMLMMLPAVFEKACYVLSTLVLFRDGFFWAALFAASFMRTDSKPVTPGPA